MTSEQAYTELARCYFRWIAPARLKEFQWFSGLGVKASKEAAEPLGLVPIEAGSEFLIQPDELDAFHAFQVEKRPSYSLVTSLDGLLLLRRDLAGFLDQADEKRKVLVDKTKKELSGLQDLPHHAILDRGRLIGLWEFDPSSKSIAWSSLFQPINN